MAEYSADDRAQKIDLGVGVYRDASGATPILNSVKDAERYLVENQATKTYLGSSGAADFNAAMQSMVFGRDVAESERITTLQTPGGSGSLRVAAGVILRASPDTKIWAGQPTWANHVPLLSSAGIEMKALPYYDAETKSIRFEEMLEAVGKIPSGDIVLLHGCCHNPTGMDLDKGQWDAITEVVARNGVIPFVDFAYQGFGDGLQEDAYGIRGLFAAVPEMLVSASCSKNFALYRDRVGSLSFVTATREAGLVVRNQANNVVRTMYSMPPDHGAAVVSHILGDSARRSVWEGEVAEMRDRLNGMRTLLTEKMVENAAGHDFSHFARGKGMFAFVGISPEQVARLKQEFAVYMVASSRINIAGITEQNVDHFAKSVAAVL
jgi:aspartate/tyrosine/aromatic aminotransferase